MSDYIEITDLNEVIRYGDEYAANGSDSWMPFCSSIGEVLGETHWFNGQAVRIRVRRPVWSSELDRLINIEQKAIALLRREYRIGVLLGWSDVEMYEKNNPHCKELREALGMTKEEVRGEK